MVSIRVIAKKVGRFVTKRFAKLRPACFCAKAAVLDDEPQYMRLDLFYTPSPVKQRLQEMEDLIDLRSELGAEGMPNDCRPVALSFDKTPAAQEERPEDAILAVHDLLA